MKKHNLWFILTLTCLACGCGNILTFSANECDDGDTLCFEHKRYECTNGKWNKTENECEIAECADLNKRQCIDGKITICQKVENRQEWVKTDETCITCDVGKKQCSDTGKTLVCQIDGDKYAWVETEEDCVICVIGEKKCNDTGKTLVCQIDGDKYAWVETEEDCVICMIGEKKCSDAGKTLVCQKDDNKYDWVETAEKCGSICNTDDTKCEGGNIYTCTADGKWGDSPKPCENGCSEGSVQAANNPLECYDCGLDKVECENSILTICNNHKLEHIPCDYGCMKSVTSAYCRECTKGETMCEKGAIYTCGENGKWDRENKDDCVHGCFNGERNAETRVSCYECSNDNELKCTEEENGTSVIKKCLSHKWYSHTQCEFGCADDDASQCKECLDDTSKFYNDEDDLCVEMKCDHNKYSEGVTHSEYSCNRTLTNIGECKNGDVKCAEGNEGNGIFQFCLEGSWNNFGSCDFSNPCSVLNGKKCEEFQSVGHICVDEIPVTCANKASCDTENKACAACQNGTSYCNGTSIMACVNGVSEETACQPGTHCEYNEGIAQCVTSLCKNGQQRCEGQEIQYCINYKWHTVNACSDQENCAVDNDIARCDCKSDIAYCNDDRQFTTCNDGMWHVTYCEENELCKTIAGKPKCIECEAGQFKCKDGAIISCQGNKWTEPAACTDNGTCDDSEGNAKCICTQGQAKCAKDNTKIIRCQENGQYSEEEETCGEDMHCEGIAGSAVCTKDQMECTPGAKQCKENSLETCNEKGKWVNAVTCEKGCNVNTLSCNACRAGEYNCSELENYDYACIDGQWTKRNKCKYGCNDTECHQCKTEKPRCYDIDVLKSYCEDNKKWGDTLEMCIFGCNTDNRTCNQCKPGTTQCYACGYETCSKEGKWDSQLTALCPLGCSNGQCVSGFLNKTRHNLTCIADKEGLNRIVAYENNNLSSIGYVICDNSVTCDAFKYLCEKECGEVKSICLNTSSIEYQKATYPYQTAISLRCNKPNNSFTFSAPCSSRECANEMSCANVKLNQFPQ